MDGTTAVWLGLTLAAPLTLVPEIALLRLLHSRRSGWHPLDVLIVSLLVGQLCCTIVTLGLSATALARHAGLLLGSDSFIPELLHQHRTPLCAALISFWAAAHTLHAATLTSMAVDRAMTVRWPYKYRVSVRRTQIRYHVVVLAVVSLLVGVATLFATSNTSPFLAFNQPQPPPTIINNLTNLQDGEALVQAPMPEWTCAFLPYTFDSRFSLFWLGLHGLLLLTTLTAAAVILITRIMIRFSSGFSGRLGLAGGSGSDMRTLGNASDGSSATLPLPSSSSIERPTLPAPPPPPRYTPGPVACLSGHGTASVSPLTRSSHPASMFGSTDKTFINLLHHEAGLLSNNSNNNNNNNMNNKSGHVVADFSSSAEMLDYVGCCGGGSWNRQRHSTVAAVLIVAYLTHHLPLLVLTTLGTFFVEILPVGWPFSAIILGLTLASGLLFMAVLVFIDPVLYTWMIDSLKPSSRGRGQRLRHHHHLRSPVTSESATLEANLAPMKIDEETRYRMSQIYCQEPTEAKFPLTNGSLFVHLMNPSSADGQRANRRPSRMGVSAYDHRPQQQQQQQQRSSSVAVMSAHIPEQLVPYPEAAKPPLMTFMSRARILAASNGSLKSTDTDRHCATATNSHSLMEPFYCDPLTTGIGAPPSFADVDVAPIHHNPPVSNTAKFRQEPIYASLSETLSSCHTLDSLGGRLAVDDEPPLRVERKDVVQLEEEEEEDDEGSATESAGDDFEFHNIRTSRQTLITSSSSSSSSSSNAPPTCNEAIFGLEDLRPRSRVARSATYRILCNGLDVKCTGKHDKGNQEIGQQQTSAAAAVAATSQSRHGIVTCVTIRIGQQEEEDLEQAFGETSSSLRRSKLLTSLSMNDIDVIGQDDGDQDDNDGMAELAVPARSDSLFSLYVAPDAATTPVVPQQQQLYSSITSSSRLTNQDTRRQPQQQQQQHQTGVFNLRKKSSHRSRAAVLQRFQQRSRRGKDDFKSGHVVSIAALKAALASQSPMSYLDTGDLFYSPSSLASQQQSKTVFVSDYI